MSDYLSTPNVGFHLWNVSKRISYYLWVAKESHRIVDTFAKDGVDNIEDMRDLLPKIDDAARRAELTWQRIEAASQRSDPGLIQPGLVSVIGNNGPNEALMAEVRRIRSEDNWEDEIEECYSSLLRMANRSDSPGTD